MNELKSLLASLDNAVDRAVDGMSMANANYVFASEIINESQNLWVNIREFRPHLKVGKFYVLRQSGNLCLALWTDRGWHVRHGGFLSLGDIEVLQ